MPEIARLPADGPVADTLLRDGAVIVESVIPETVLDQTLADFRGPFDEQGLKFTNDFNGYQTRRLSGVLGLSRASAEIIAHPLVMDVADMDSDE